METHQKKYTFLPIQNKSFDVSFQTFFLVYVRFWKSNILHVTPVYGISQARILEWVASSSSTHGLFLTQGLNLSLLCLLHWQAGYLPPNHLEGPLYGTYI